ncbi:MAG TPA: hypothetical protein VGJ26_06045, partial [Pirellulales bacterium]
GTEGHNNSSYLIPGATVFGSAAAQKIFATPNTTNDWYLATSSDVLHNVDPSELTLIAKTALTAGTLSPPSAIAGQAVTNVPVFHFADANPADTASDYSALVTLGDGNTVTLTSAASPYGQIVANPGGGFDVKLSYTYGEEFTNQTFGVQVTGARGQITGLSANTFSVADAPLTATGVNLSATEGQAFSNVQVGTLTDGAGVYSHPADLSATIHWGDGASSPATWTPTGAGVYAVKGSHTYAGYGFYPISVSYADVGGSTTSSSSSASVADAPLTAGALSPPAAIEGRAFTMVPVFHFTDANPAASAGDYTALVTLGDGNTVTLTSAASPYGQIVASPGGGFDVRLSYTYSQVLSNQTFGVVVTDGGGQTTGQSTGALSVAYAPLTSVGVNVSATEGAALTDVQVATLTDAAGSASQPSDLSALIHWGDNSTSAATLTPIGAGVYTVNGSHTYSGFGSYTISVSYSEVNGATTISNSTAIVADALLTAVSLTPPAATAFQTFTNVTVFHFSDANPAASASDFTALVRLDDGHTGTLNGQASPNGQIVASPGGGFDVQLSYSYNTFQTLTNQTFGVQVSDLGGQTTALSTSAFSIVPFTPEQTPNLQLWLDPYDTSRMTLRTVAALNQTAPATQQQYLSAPGGGTKDANGSYPFNFYNSDGASHTKFSFAGWVYMMAEPGDTQGSQKSPIISKTMTDGSNGSWWLTLAGTNGSLIEFGAYTNANGGVANADFSTAGFLNGQWNYIAFAYDGSQSVNANILHVWLNGTQLAYYSPTSNGTLPADLQNSSGSSASFMVGNAFNQFQTSRFADLGFWNNTVFSQNDVNHLYNSGEGLTVSTLANLPAGLQSPFAYYRLNETSGVRDDLSGHNYNLTPSSADGSTLGSTIYVEQWDDKSGVAEPFIAGDSTRVGTTHTFQAKRIREPEYQPNGAGPGVPCVTFNAVQWLYSDTANWERVTTGTIFENSARSNLISGTEDFDFSAFDQSQSTERLFETGYETPTGSGAPLPANWLRIQGNQGGTDLVSSNGTANSCVVTSASYAFTSKDIGKSIRISDGTNWIAQTAFIVSVSHGAATMNIPMGFVANLSGGDWTMLSGGSAVTTLNRSSLLAGDTYPLADQFNSREFSAVDTTMGTGTTPGPWRMYVDGQPQTVYVGDGGNGNNLPNGWTTIVPTQTGLGINCYDQGSGSFSSGTQGGTLSMGDLVSYAPMISTTADAMMRTWMAGRLQPFSNG